MQQNLGPIEKQFYEMLDVMWNLVASHWSLKASNYYSIANDTVLQRVDMYNLGLYEGKNSRTGIFLLANSFGICAIQRQS